MTGAQLVLAALGAALLVGLALYLRAHLRWRREMQFRRDERELVRREWDMRIEEFRRAYPP